uniref:Uncharacterized protein n=1 Tax=Anguilla anguilla TaxID=7936 RepID=A0A0E9SIP6_ANGAN
MVPNSVAELGPLIGRALKGEVGEPHRNIPADVEPGAPAGVSKGSPFPGPGAQHCTVPVTLTLA